MKKKFMFLLVGAFGIFGLAKAQGGYTPAPGVPYTFGQFITINVPGVGPTQFYITTYPDPSQPGDGDPANPSNEEVWENYAQDVLIGQGAYVEVNGTAGFGFFNPALGAQAGPNPGTSDDDDYLFGIVPGTATVQLVPFDFGISAVLGAGALAAVKTARRRKKELEAAA